MPVETTNATVELIKAAATFVVAIAGLIGGIVALVKVLAESKARHKRDSELTRELRQLREDYALLKQDHKKLHVSFEGLVDLLGESDRKVSTLQTSYDLLKATYEKLDANYNELRARYDLLKIQYDDLKDENERLKAKVNGVEKRQTGSLGESK